VCFELSGLKDKVVAELKEIYDPEIPINIYDLGLIKNIDIDEKTKIIRIQMIYNVAKLCNQFCPWKDILTVQVKHRVRKTFPSYELVLNIDSETEWHPTMATEKGLEELKDKFGEDFVNKIISGTTYSKVKIPEEIFPAENTIDFMRKWYEMRYNHFKDWFEKTKVKV